MSDIVPIRRALVSVSDKDGLVPFVEALVRAGAEVVSTGGTAAALRAAGLPVVDAATLSGFPEILDGRVKTLVPQVHGGILGRRDDPAHQAQLTAHGIAPIDLGGPALIRAAAKNHDFVVVATEPSHYAAIAEEIAAYGGTTLELRRRLAGEAYARTAAYDAAIAAWFAGNALPDRVAI